MNFVMDLSVEEFLTLDAESHMVDEIPHIVKKIYDTANILVGETFSKETPVTELSGTITRFDDCRYRTSQSSICNPDR
jgi:ABC-type lipoprotein export system ATPase subunit